MGVRRPQLGLPSDLIRGSANQKIGEWAQGLIDRAMNLIIIGRMTQKIITAISALIVISSLTTSCARNLPELVQRNIRLRIEAGGEPPRINIDDELLHYGKILIETVREKTTSQNEEDYPCKCGGYCERDFANT